MLWLQTPPWGRWMLAGAIAAVALWVEVRPDPTAQHLFASTSIATGELIGNENTHKRAGPAGLLRTARLGEVALSDIAEGDPVLASQGGTAADIVPQDWWLIELDLPDGARRGASARVVLLDTGSVVPAVVAAAPLEDPLGGGSGSVAVDLAHAAEVAAAAADGRVAVMIESG